MNATHRQIKDKYEYRDRNGNLKKLNIRYNPKDFSQRFAMIENPDPEAPDDPKQWSRKKLDDFKEPLYHEDKIAKRPGETIYFCEGEKDADNLAKYGYLTTCHKAGGGVISDTEGLIAGRDVVIIGDNDPAGEDYAKKARKNLSKPEEDADSVTVVFPPGGVNDLSDWIDQQDSAETNEEVKRRFETWAKPEDIIEPLSAVWDDPPKRAPELIAGLLRQGHKMILSGTSKAGKSFALLQLAAALVEGRDWIQTFHCDKSRVLYLNLEIDRPSMIQRIINVYENLGWTPVRQNQEKLFFYHLRGRTAPLETMKKKIIRTAQKNDIQAIIFDPIYKVGLSDENSAGDIAQFCRILDEIATATGAAVIYCHHFSKGAQDSKSPIDRASGSGVFARDADAILTLTELQEPGGFLLECILREFKSPPPLYLRFVYPLHVPAPELEGTPIKTPGRTNSLNAQKNYAAEKADREKKKIEEEENWKNDIVKLAKKQGKKPLGKTDFISACAGKLRIGKTKAQNLVCCLIAAGRLQETTDKKNNNTKTITAPVEMEQGKML